MLASVSASASASASCMLAVWMDQQECTEDIMTLTGGVMRSVSVDGAVVYSHRPRASDRTGVENSHFPDNLKCKACRCHASLASAFYELHVRLYYEYIAESNLPSLESIFRIRDNPVRPLCL